MTVLIRAFALACLSLHLVSPSAVVATSRSLTIRTSANGQLTVQGSGWRSGPVALSVSIAPWTAGALIKPAPSGSFRVAIEGATRCEAIIVNATDTHGHHAAGAGPEVGCPPPPVVRSPRIVVLKGVRMQPIIVGIILPHPQVVSVHIAEEIYLWEPRNAAPMYGPTVDSKYLAVIRQGTTVPRPCARTDCGQGFFWRWIAVRPGDTGITLSAACRQATPPCMIPDFFIRVHIVP